MILSNIHMKHYKLPMLVAATAAAVLAVPLLLQAQLWYYYPPSDGYSGSSSSRTDVACLYPNRCRSSSSSSWTSSASTSSACSDPEPVLTDLSVILDTDQQTVGAGQDISYSVKVRNGGTDDSKGITVFLLRNDMDYVESSVFCFVTADPGYVTCTVPPLPAGQSTTFSVTMRASPGFNCIESSVGRSVFAFVRAPLAPTGGTIDLYPQNNTSNIVNTLPVCE